MNEYDFSSNIFSQKILVIGDFLVDEYIYGYSTRVAREAPVIVVQYNSSNKRLGGAGNAVKNALAWGGTVVPIGFVGNDQHGKFIVDSLSNLKVQTDYLVVVDGHNTSIKRRVWSGSKRGDNQQVFRLDHKNSGPYRNEYQRQITQKLKKALKFVQPDLILISDYGEGALTGALTYELGQSNIYNNCPVFVDSRHNMGNYRGARAIIANAGEVEEFLSTKVEDGWEIKSAGERVLEKTGAKSLLMTVGNQGMYLFSSSLGMMYVEADNRFRPQSIIGVGDSVAISFSRSLVASGDSGLALRTANTTAGISVSQPEESCVSLNKVLEFLALEKNQ